MLVNAFEINTDGTETLVFMGDINDVLRTTDTVSRGEAIAELAMRHRIFLEACGVMLLLTLATIH